MVDVYLLPFREDYSRVFSQLFSTRNEKISLRLPLDRDEINHPYPG
jgi:hypothetical protein